jgi:hypothetical protein
MFLITWRKRSKNLSFPIKNIFGIFLVGRRTRQGSLDRHLKFQCLYAEGFLGFARRPLPKHDLSFINRTGAIKIKEIKNEANGKKVS